MRTTCTILKLATPLPPSILYLLPGSQVHQTDYLEQILSKLLSLPVIHLPPPSPFISSFRTQHLFLPCFSLYLGFDSLPHLP